MSEGETNVDMLVHDMLLMRKISEVLTQEEAETQVRTILAQEGPLPFQAQMLLSLICQEQPRLSAAVQRLMADSDYLAFLGEDLIHRDDVPVSVVVSLAFESFWHRIGAGNWSPFGALAHQKAPVWLLNVAYQLELIARRNPATDEYTHELLENPMLPLPARAVLTVQGGNLYASPYSTDDPDWLHHPCGWLEVGPGDEGFRISETIRQQVEEQYPELAGLPLGSFLIPTLSSLPVTTTGWDDVPAKYAAVVEDLLNKYRSWAKT